MGRDLGRDAGRARRKRPGTRRRRSGGLTAPPSAPTRPPVHDDGIELWGGIECSIVRVGDRFRDQVRETGHRDRPADLDALARLGFRTLRYPVLWESVTPDLDGPADFGWHDERLARLARLGIEPIVGLLHHGSGPRGTDLLDPDFPEKLARHAATVAGRYPHVTRFTPVNEPMTTARFSGLYGHWFPHARDESSFLRALVNQCRGVLLAMQAIRRVTPGALLVQTEDLGRVFSTDALAYQADYENERRWLTFDLLCGRLDRRHGWWSVLRANGVPERDLDALLSGEARPDILGVNHYLTSDRFLDERADRYPPHLTGGNGRDRYADVEAVRMPLPPGQVGPAARLREVWERYRAPIAVTEVHHGSTRDEQMRWLATVWDAARAVRREGVDLRTVTPWALFGARDWNSLLTRDTGIYEPGAFDVRGPEPRPTALAAQCRDIIVSGTCRHPVLDGPGWWERPERHYWQPSAEPSRQEPDGLVRTILIAGASEPWRATLAAATAWRGLASTFVGPHETARARTDLVSGAAWAVVTLDGTAARDETVLADACRDAGAPLLAVLPEPRFAGDPTRPATEHDPLLPGSDAAERENRLRRACPTLLLVRTGPLFAPGAVAALQALARPDPDGVPVSPTFLPDLVHNLLDLLIDREAGIRHLFSGTVSPAALASLLSGRAGLPPEGDGGPAQHGRIGLATDRGNLMPPLASALDRCFALAPPVPT